MEHDSLKSLDNTSNHEIPALLLQALCSQGPASGKTHSGICPFCPPLPPVYRGEEAAEEGEVRVPWGEGGPAALQDPDEPLLQGRTAGAAGRGWAQRGLDAGQQEPSQAPPSPGPGER